VADGYLVPPKAVSVPLKFQREGIRYDELSDDEKDQWDALEWDEDGGDPPTRSSAEAVNKWLFNTDTVDKVLAPDDRATRWPAATGWARPSSSPRTSDHAEFIAERFNANYPHHKGEFARVITFKTEYAQSLIDDFSARTRCRTSPSRWTCSTPASTCPRW
jgi:type I restriction enzyme R subunit